MKNIKRMLAVLKNPRWFIYDVFMVIRRPMPVWMAKKMMAGTKPQLPSAVLLKTYDGGAARVTPPLLCSGESPIWHALPIHMERTPMRIPAFMYGRQRRQSGTR